MQRVTVKLEEETIEVLDELAEQQDVSRSEVIRKTLADGLKMDDLRAEYESEIAELERDVDRLRNEKQTLIEQRETTTELVEYVEEERSYRSAPIWRRAKWWVLGKGEPA